MINQHKNYFKKIPSPKFFKFKNRSLANEKQKERERGAEKKIFHSPAAFNFYSFFVHTSVY